MQLTLLVLLLGIGIAVGYGVAFSRAYPLIEVDGSLASLFAILGLLTALGIVGAWNAVMKK